MMGFSICIFSITFNPNFFSINISTFNWVITSNIWFGALASPLSVNYIVGWMFLLISWLSSQSLSTKKSQSVLMINALVLLEPDKWSAVSFLCEKLMTPADDDICSAAPKSIINVAKHAAEKKHCKIDIPTNGGRGSERYLWEKG